MIILGFQAGFDPVHSRSVLGEISHDSSAVVIRDGVLLAAFEEERMDRIKHSNKIASLSVNACMSGNGISASDIDEITIPCIESYADAYIRGVLFPETHEEVKGVRALAHEVFRNYLGFTVPDQKLTFIPHHQAHAASAYYCSGYKDALVLVLDGSGDIFSGIACSVSNGVWKNLREFSVAQSLGEFYLCATRYLGYNLFDEYKVMGLAPYGDARKYKKLFHQSYELNPAGDYEILGNLEDLLCEVGPRRKKGEPITQFHKDIAAALQDALEDIVFHLIRYLQKETGHRKLCLAGGVAHNCTLNGKILYSALFDDVFVQPASHDGGLALGGALFAYYNGKEKKDKPYQPPPPLEHVYLGTDIGSNDQIYETLDTWKSFVEFEYESDISERAAQLLSDGAIIGWVQGRAEFGPRALGNRSILADPRPPENMSIINKMVKKRESFRPFAPAVLEEYVEDYFEIPNSNMRFPFMTFVMKVRATKRQLLGATTHVDGTARIQTVSKKTNQPFWSLIDAFHKRTGVPVLLNTSFNNNAEPIVDSVNDAIVCFLTTDLHYLIIGNYLIKKKNVQPKQFLQTILSVPAFCSLVQSRKFISSSEVSWVWELQKNYDTRWAMPISPEVYRLLSQADGKTSLGMLFRECKINRNMQAKIIEEIKELWAARSLILAPKCPEGLFAHSQIYTM